MFIAITILYKTCVFFGFGFFVLFTLVTVHAKADPWGRPHATYTTGSFDHTFLTLQKQTLLSKGALDICTRAGLKTLPKSEKINWSGVPEGSHSRPPGRSKSMVFKRISPGREAPSDAWPMSYVVLPLMDDRGLRGQSAR